MLTLPLLNREPDDIEPGSLPSVLADLLVTANPQGDQGGSYPLIGVTLNLTREDFDNLDAYFKGKWGHRYFNTAVIEKHEAPYLETRANGRTVVLCQIPRATAQNLHYILQFLGQSEAVKSADFLCAVVTVGYFTLMA